MQGIGPMQGIPSGEGGGIGQFGLLGLDARAEDTAPSGLRGTVGGDGQQQEKQAAQKQRKAQYGLSRMQFIYYICNLQR
jgi:hypothetical protein